MKNAFSILSCGSICFLIRMFLAFRVRVALRQKSVCISRKISALTVLFPSSVHRTLDGHLGFATASRGSD